MYISFLKKRYSLKLLFFKSPMSEIFSLNAVLHFTWAKLLYKIKNYKKKGLYKKESNHFNEKGFVTFSNNKIRRNCEIILNKLESSRNIWEESNSFRGFPTDAFRVELIEIFRSGVDQFIKDTFSSDYYIFYHVMYKSERLKIDKKEEGSELWHADGGPGTCMNLMICHTPINKNNGSMKIINWEKSKQILSRLFYENKQINKNISPPNSRKKRLYLRKLKCEILKDIIKEDSIKYFQPNSQNSGIIYAFRNNCVHAGGYTELGNKRIVSVMHIYPSTKKTSLNEKFLQNHEKTNSYPEMTLFS